VPADHELRRLVLGREEPITIRPADLLEPQVENARRQLKKMGLEPTDDNVLIHLLFPNLAPDYFRGPEKEVPGQPAAVTAPDPPPPAPETAVPDPPRTPVQSSAEFDVEVDGEVFKVKVSGAGMTVMQAAVSGPPAGAPSTPAPPKVGEGTVIAPMQGLIVKMPVKVGDSVKLGDVVAVLEAMKMQNDIVTTVAGRVSQVYVKEGEVVSPNQPLLAVG
jgi:pyruvate carboxylase subunit B